MAELAGSVDPAAIRGLVEAVLIRFAGARTDLSAIPSVDIAIDSSRTSSSSSSDQTLPPYCSPSASIRMAARFGPLSGSNTSVTTRSSWRASRPTVRRSRVRFSVVALVVYVGLIYLTYLGFKRTPTGFIPQQDKGYLILTVGAEIGGDLVYRQRVGVTHAVTEVPEAFTPVLASAAIIGERNRASAARVRSRSTRW